MRNVKRLVATSLIISLGVFNISACDNTFVRTIKKPFVHSDLVFQASTRFMYSTDGGTSWSETLQEVPVGESYYLAIEMQVSQDEESKDENVIVATITIPNTDVLDCYLDDHPGTSITGQVDSATNTVSYDFNLVASTTPEKFRVVFECQPIDTGRARVEVVYDDNVSENWDATGTIRYVEAEDVEPEYLEVDDIELEPVDIEEPETDIEEEHEEED